MSHGQGPNPGVRHIYPGTVPPPYAPRDQAGPSSSAAPPPNLPPSNSNLEFSETSAVTLTWNLSGLSQMYTSSVGEAKSKCIKSAIFGDADNLWEVLWYPNSGVQGGEYASLYLSCVQERDSSIGTKWARRGLWWFRFEIRSSVPDERGKPVVLATKDASDHTFAVKTANWGWQQFARRDTLFKHPLAAATDSFVISCTIQAQAQPPAGYWLGVGIPPSVNVNVRANVDVPVLSAGTASGQPGQQGQGAQGGQGQKYVGSGGGLSAWAGGEGASGGVAGGTAAGGGVKRVVPRDLVIGIGSMLDDELYSDVVFIIPPARSHKHPYPSTRSSALPASRRIYANKKLLSRYDYFRAMFSGGFASSHSRSHSYSGTYETDDGNMFEPDEFDADSDADAQGNDENDVDDPDDFDAFSDSDAEDEAAEWIAEVGGPGGKRGTDRLEAGEGQGEEIDDFSVGQPRAGMGATGGRKTSAGPDSAADNSGSVGAEAQNPTPAGRGNAEQEDRESITSEDGTSTQSSLGTERSEEEGSGGDVSMSDDTRDKAEGAEDGTPKSRGAKLASPARSLRGMGSASKKGKADNRTAQGRGKGKGRSIGPSKTKVVIKDAAWSTWWALLYWIYTDIIYFAPLTSTFTHPTTAPGNPSSASPGPTGGSGGALGLTGPGSNTAPAPPGGAANRSLGPTYASRAEWIQAWLADRNTDDNPANSSGGSGAGGGAGVAAHILPPVFTETAHGPCPRPVSAKAIYRLADKLDILPLKLRAFQHIMAGMNAANVPAEVFSRFSSTFEDVRKVQVAYFLKHWSEIKKSETMMQIWQQIRHGKHVGFEEVWPLIVGQLDFKPS